MTGYVLRLRDVCCRAQWTVSRAYFNRRDVAVFGPVRHGPQTWPWWRLLSVSLVRLRLPDSGYRVWLYTRWDAVLVSVYLGRARRWFP
jgi:hypothetical protein